MFNYKYLTKEHLDGFDNYKYMAKDTSPLSVYVMHPFWNRVVEYVPRWVAPNTLTFVGFLFTVLNFLLLTHFDYGFWASTLSAVENATGQQDQMLIDATAHEAVPNWCWTAMAVFLFLAYTLDGIDGKQARRTQTSGPLGELFDHGLDSYSVFFIPACLYSVFGRLDHSGSPLKMYFILLNVLLNFFISHWEKYNTGLLFLPWGYDFSMWAGIIVFLLTGMYGHKMWKVTFAYGITSATIFEIAVYGGLLSNLPVALYNTYNSYKHRTGKMRSPAEALRPLWSLLTLLAVCTVWVLRSPSNVMERDPRVVYLLMGTLFSNSSSRLIVSQMSGTRCELVCWLLWPLSAAVCLAFLVSSLEIFSLYAVTLLVVLAHIHYGTCVVRQMCEHFRISCFRIKKRSD